LALLLLFFWRDKFWWSVIDVGGHTPERAKWATIVKNGINAMIYFVALDDFATDSGEEIGKNKMDISKLVWEEVVNSELFEGECTVLFLNKCDLFRDQIENEEQYRLFKECFPEYNGQPNADQALEFVKNVFLALSTRKRAEDIYAHYTCAIDSEQMSVIWSALKDNVFKERIKHSFGLQV